jgi:hypothetical protein
LSSDGFHSSPPPLAQRTRFTAQWKEVVPPAARNRRSYAMITHPAENTVARTAAAYVNRFSILLCAFPTEVVYRRMIFEGWEEGNKLNKTSQLMSQLSEILVGLEKP